MDPLRIESYLRSACSVLDFDIGEIWCARKTLGMLYFVFPLIDILIVYF